MSVAAREPVGHGRHEGHVGRDGGAREAGGLAPKRIVVGYGFWLFLVSDIIMFSAFFAAYAVLSTAVDGGPTGRELFSVWTVALETTFLLLSTFACAMATLAASVRNLLWTQVALFATGLLGAGFLTLELHEFWKLIDDGAGPQRSAFLSAFFALVGCHGVHVAVAILWCGTMMAQLAAKGFREDVDRRMLCFSLFWHALDIVWIGVFTIVYLMGARA